mmetsp:Transcript_20196/g.49530  ORF Transcript_20196/g.49530 Transcript_20196/m.49530 type:complete len:118 (+) Transcript_20196:397-750(+)
MELVTVRIIILAILKRYATCLLEPLHRLGDHMQILLDRRVRLLPVLKKGDECEMDFRLLRIGNRQMEGFNLVNIGRNLSVGFELNLQVLAFLHVPIAGKLRIKPVPRSETQRPGKLW